MDKARDDDDDLPFYRAKDALHTLFNQPTWKNCRRRTSRRLGVRKQI